MGYSIIYDVLIVSSVYIVYKYVSKWKDSIDYTKALRLKQELSMGVMKHCDFESEKQYNHPDEETFRKMEEYASSLGLAYSDSKHRNIEFDFKYYAPLYLSRGGVLHSKLLSSISMSDLDNEHRIKVLKAISKNLREQGVRGATFVRPLLTQRFSKGGFFVSSSNYYLELIIQSHLPPEYYDYEYERIT